MTTPRPPLVRASSGLCDAIAAESQAQSANQRVESVRSAR
jgi:hypothetical protein